MKKLKRRLIVAGLVASTTACSFYPRPRLIGRVDEPPAKFAEPLRSAETTPLSVEGINNLKALARVFGHVRFHQVVPQTESLDWNLVATVAVSQAEGATSPKQLAEAMSGVFTPLSPTMRFYAQDNAGESSSTPVDADSLRRPNAKHSFRDFLSCTEFEDEQSGADVDQYGSVVLWGSGHSRFHYQTPDDPKHADFFQRRRMQAGAGVELEFQYALPESLGSDFKAVKDAMEYIRTNSTESIAYDRNYRIASVIVAWNNLRFCWPYFQDDPDMMAKWEAALEPALIEAAEAEGVYGSRAALRKMVATLHDSRVQIESAVPDLAKVHEKKVEYEDYKSIANLDWREGQVVVVAVPQSERAKPQTLAVGDVIVEVRGQPLEPVIMEAQRFESESSESLRVIRAVERMMSQDFPTKESPVTVLRKGQRVELVARLAETVDRQFSGRPMTVLAGGVGYVDLARIDSREFHKQKEQLLSTNAVIFDLRRSADTPAAWLLSHFISGPLTLPSTTLVRPGANGPTHRKTIPGKTIEQGDGRYQGKLYVLTDHTMDRAAELLLMALGERVIRVGRPNAGRYGGDRWVFLPLHRLRFSTERISDASGKIANGRGLSVHHTVEPTIQAVKEGRDEFLDEARKLAASSR